MANHPKSVNITSFKGLNNVGSPENTAINYLKKALNVNIDKTGNISKRKGYTKVANGSWGTIWASQNGLGCYGSLDNDLVQIYPDYSTILLRENVGTYLSFEEVDGRIYYTSPIHNGIIFNGSEKPWGVERNTLSPTLSITTGNLPTGIYQVNFTYVYTDGRESGCSRASIIELTGTSGINVQIPTHSDPGVVYARVYCSTQNGSTLYFSGLATLGSTYTVSSVSGLIDPLRFFNIDKAPKGHICKYYRGRMYVAQNNILWYSEPFQYDQFRLDSNYFEFPDEILEVMPVEDGIWVGSDKLYYLSGEEPEKFKRSTKEEIKIVPGTSTKVSGSYIHMDNTPIGYKWLVSSDLGVWVLFNQGLCINLTSQNIALDSAISGTSIFIQDGGMNNYLSILNKSEKYNNSVFGDLVETKIIRNGVVIS